MGVVDLACMFVWNVVSLDMEQLTVQLEYIQETTRPQAAEVRPGTGVLPTAQQVSKIFLALAAIRPFPIIRRKPPVIS